MPQADTLPPSSMRTCSTRAPVHSSTATAFQRRARLPSSCSCTSLTCAPSAARMRTRPAATPFSASPRTTCTRVTWAFALASTSSTLKTLGWAASSVNSNTAGSATATPSATVSAWRTAAFSSRKASTAEPIPLSAKAVNSSSLSPTPAGRVTAKLASPQSPADSGRAAAAGAALTPHWFQVGTGRRFILVSFIKNAPSQPMLPFISRWIRLFISTAYSTGSSLAMGSAKPPTISARASSSDRPRLMR